MTEPLFKRYNLALITSQYNDMRKWAKKKKTPMSDLFRKCVRLGLMVMQAQENDPDATVVIVEKGKEKKMIMIF